MHIERIIVALFLPILISGILLCTPLQAMGYATPAIERPALEIERFTVNHGDLITDRHDVTFQLSVRDDVTKEEQLRIRLSNDALTWSRWAPYRTTGKWTLEGGHGSRTLYIEVRDEIGNSASASASILIYVPAASIRLEPVERSFVSHGAPTVLNATVIPGNATNRQVSWRSSNPTVAMVDESGMVSPLAPGEALITAWTIDGGYSASCRVEVRPAPAALNISSPVVYGDLSGDGAVNVDDAIILLRSIVGLTQLTPEQERCADVNEDGKIDVADAIVILRYIVGLVDELPVEPDGPGEEPTPGEEDPPPDKKDPLEPPIIELTSKLRGATYRVRTLGTVTCSRLNVRSGAGKKNELIGYLDRGVSKFIEEVKNIDDNSCPVWYRIEHDGKAGWISANYVDIENTLYGLDHASNECQLAPAPESLAPGDYKVDAQYNFDRLEGGKRVPTGVNFYFLKHCPYAILPLERPAPNFVTAGYLAAKVKQIRADSPFADERIARGFLDTQRTWGLSAHYLVAHAALESAWGTSAIARDKNNILGFMAYDDSPYLSAATFKTMADCALYVGGYIRKAYLSEGGTYFNGPHLVGMNEKYATDPMWAIKIARVMQSMIVFNDGVPADKMLQRGMTTAGLNLRRGPGTEHSLIVKMAKGSALQINGMTAVDDTTWFKVAYQGESGWCSGKYVALQTRPRGAIYYSNWYSMGSPDRVNVRREPHTGAAIEGKLDFADPFAIENIEMAADSSGRWYPWYLIESGSLSGWVRGDLVIVDW